MMDVLQVGCGEVRVYLRRREAGVSEHLLHAAQVGTSLEEVCREGMSHVMRVIALVDAGTGQDILEGVAQRLGAHRVAACREEQGIPASRACELRT